METNTSATYFYHILNNNHWKDEPCYIVGGGNSLEGFDFGILEGAGRVIAVNQSIQKVPFADIYFSMDSRYLRWIREGTLGNDTLNTFREYKGMKVWINTEMDKIDYHHDVYILEHSGNAIVCRDMKKGIWTGGNSGLSALQLAAVLGCNPIYLLGFDMKQIGGKTHHHAEYPEPTDPQAIEAVHPKQFNRIAKQFDELGIRVININQPDTSALECFTFGKMILQEPTYVSFYTPEYKPCADELELSLNKYNLKYEIRPIKSLGSWEKNCNYKPIFIREMMEKYKTPIVWLDADATVESYPLLFDNITADIAVHFRRGLELLSGTIFLNNTDEARQLVDIWVKEAQSKLHELDQISLKYSVDCWKGKLMKLPERYCNIFDLMNVPNPVITHHQASRKYRNIK